MQISQDLKCSGMPLETCRAFAQLPLKLFRRQSDAGGMAEPRLNKTQKAVHQRSSIHYSEWLFCLSIMFEYMSIAHVRVNVSFEILTVNGSPKRKEKEGKKKRNLIYKE
jgi:hypothetical protein